VGSYRIGPIALPRPDAYAERWVRSVKEECLSNLILLGEGSLRRALRHYEADYHEERNHQGKDNVLLFPLPTQAVRGERDKVRCRERLGGLLKYYEREAV
jgi:putative transposase